MRHEILYVLCVVVLAMQLVTIVLPNWGKISQGGGHGNMGLWKACAKVNDKSKSCLHLPPKDDKNFPSNSLHAVQAMSILGVVCVFLAMSVALMRMNKNLVLGLLVLGGLASIVAMIVWAAELKKLKDPSGKVTEWDFDYCYWLSGLAGILALTAAGYLHFSNRSSVRLSGY